MEIYTIGGGEIVYEVLKAVAMCLNGGSGMLTALLRIHVRFIKKPECLS